MLALFTEKDGGTMKGVKTVGYDDLFLDDGTMKPESQLKQSNVNAKWLKYLRLP